MSADFSEVELGLVVDLGTLRGVLKELNVAGRRWWLSSDPQDAAETGYITIAHGTVGAYDRFNTLHFRVPVLWNDRASGRTDRLILIMEASTVTEEEPDYDEDEVQDLYSFILPIQEALIARLQASV
jgi:hypothetical protein